MAEHVYKFIELVGTSEESWEKAAASAVTAATMASWSSATTRISRRSIPWRVNSPAM